MTGPRAYSLAFLTTPDIGPVEAIEVAVKAGYQMVGVRILPALPEEGPYPLLTSDKLLREVASALADTGIRIGDVEIIRLKADTDIQDFCNFFERAQLLRARHVIVVSDDTDKARLDHLDNVPLELLNIFQICDAPAAFDPSPETIRHMARTARQIPGEGELDLQSLIPRMPESAIVSIEVPSRRLMRDYSPYERAKRALESTRAIYSQI